MLNLLHNNFIDLQSNLSTTSIIGISCITIAGLSLSGYGFYYLASKATNPISTVKGLFSSIFGQTHHVDASVQAIDNSEQIIEGLIQTSLHINNTDQQVIDGLVGMLAREYSRAADRLLTDAAVQTDPYLSISHSHLMGRLEHYMYGSGTPSISIGEMDQSVF